MSNSLYRLQVGVVGVEPGIVFLESTDDESTIFSPGFINSVEQANNLDIKKGDFIFIKYENGTLQEIAIPEVDGNGVITLLPVAGDFNAGGPITGGQNVGGGVESFKDIAAGLMRFRTLVAGSNVTIVEGTDTITIDTPTPPGGVINDGQNLGAGEGVFATASGDNLQFKSLVAGANINLSASGTEITIEATSAAGGTITDGVNLGTGNGVFESAVGSDLRFKGLKSGDNITIVPDADSLTISASSLGGGDISNGINIGGGAEVFKEVVVPSMVFRTLVAGSNVTITENANDITIAASGGGGGGNFDYLNTWFLAENGDDSNDGHSVNTPKQTMAAVEAAFTDFRNKINILDAGTYPCNIFGNANAGYEIYIDAPDAVFTSDGGNPVFGVSGGTVLTVNCSAISGPNNGNVAIVIYGDVACNVSVNARNVFCSLGPVFACLLDNDQESLFSVNCGRFISQLGSPNSFSCVFYLDADYVSADFNTSSTAISADGKLFINTKIFEGNITGAGEVTGKLGGNAENPDVYVGAGFDLSDQSTIREIYPVEVKTASFELQSEDSNKLFLLDEDTPNIVVRLPAYADNPDLPIGFRAWFIQTGPVRAIFDTFDSIFTPNNYLYTSGRGALVQATLLELNGSDYVWGLSGDLAPNAGTTSVAIYVSKVNGSDVDGDGTLGNPYGSITQAMSVIGTPSIMTPVIVLDGETYEENVVIPEGNIALLGPEATVAAPIGDSIQITSSSGSNIINLFQVGSGGSANAISCTQTGTTAFLNIDKIEENIDISVTGVNLSINSRELDGDIAVASGSALTYITNTRTGSDSGAGSISGLYPGMPVLSAPPAVIPWTSWNYFVWAGGNLAWSQANAINGAPYSGGSTDYGDVDLIIPVDGNYRFSAAYITENNKAIMSITIDGVTQNIDMYSAGASGASYTWEQLLTAGTYPVNLNNLTKNPSSSDYQMLLFNNGVSVTRVGPLP